jgi:ribosome-binding protein aMBF1 (putative translation factor)
VDIVEGERMANSAPGKWEQIRARKLADPATRERYERTRRSVALIRQVLQTIDARREEAGLSKAELAERVGAHPSAVRRILTSEASNPTLKTVAELLDVLGLELALRPKPEARSGRRQQAAQPAGTSG